MNGVPVFALGFDLERLMGGDAVAALGLFGGGGDDDEADGGQREGGVLQGEEAVGVNAEITVQDPATKIALDGHVL